MQPEITIGGHRFERVATRANGVRVYRGSNRYLRIGPHAALADEVALQRRMLDAGFPVAELVAEGAHQGAHYVIERSLGVDTLGDRFDAETRASGAISSASFDLFLGIVARFARAQISQAVAAPTPDDLRRLTRVDDLISALPEMATRTERAFELAGRRLAVFPAVLTHGDFHAFNVCAGGVIDLETACRGPAGYDVITAVLLPELFPPDPRDYRFSVEQRTAYLRAIDELFVGSALPAPSNYLNDFRLCKATWLTARRERPPSILGWLDSQYCELLDAYLSD